MKGKVLNAKRDGKNTYITKQTKYGTFHSKVTVADEDKDIANDLDGFCFAEIKCDIQAIKIRAKYLEQRALGIQHAYNVLLKSGIQEEDEVMRKLARQLKVAEREAQAAEEGYKTIQNNFKDYIDCSLSVRRKIKNLKKN